METAYLKSPEFWQSDECHVMVNDRDSGAVVQSEMLSRWCVDRAQLRGHLLFSTSGSTGDSKWVALSRRAIMTSAEAVNEHLQVTPRDHWLLALPTFHVGGMGVVARAHLASCGLSLYQKPWNAQQFYKALDNGTTLTSLVPTQLSDLITAGLKAPRPLRAMLIGGGPLSNDLYQKAIQLGWPIIETYGMTESSSQVATASVSDRRLKVLSCWHTRIESGGLLSIKGGPLLSAYLHINNGNIIHTPALNKGWFRTSDRVDITNGYLTVNGRSDRCAKVLGELVDLAGIESSLVILLGSVEVVVIAIPDQRRGSRLVAVLEGNARVLAAKIALDEYNQTCSPVARIVSTSSVDKFPRTALGKVSYTKLIDFFIQDEKLVE